MKKQPLAALVAAVLVVAPLVVDAHSPMDRETGTDLVQLADRSNLIFIGSVEKVAHRNARRVNEGEGAIPYTIVTYRISRVLRGKAPADLITMRFVGGPDGRGRFLTVSGVPIIQEGDQDLLFVQDTRDPSCPLVFCELGRYRILNDAVFDTYGSPVRSVEGSKIIARGTPPREFSTIRFAAPAFEELMRNPEVAAELKAKNIAVGDARRRYAAEAPKTLEIGEEFPAPGREADASKDGPPPEMFQQPPPIALSKFVDATEEAIRTARRAPIAVISIDPSAEIVPARLKVTAPQKITPGRVTPSASDAKEYRALQQNKFNPVLPK